MTTLLLGHSDAICPKPWHLKHHLKAFGVGLDRVCGVVLWVWDNGILGFVDVFGLGLV